MLIYPVFIPFAGCPFQCIYCDQKEITKSETETFNPELLKQFIKTHVEEEIEVAFYGGTFTALTFEKQKSYFEQIKQTTEKPINFRISTRPDCISSFILEFLKENHVTTIELGVQSFSDTVLQKSDRGYGYKEILESCELIKKQGFRLSIQLMPGLPGDNKETILSSVQECIKIKPDFVRLYPTIVIRNTELERQYHSGKFIPISLTDMLDILVEVTEMIRKNQIEIIKIGLHSDLNVKKNIVVAGPWHPNIGEIIKGIEFYKKIIERDTSFIELRLSKYDISKVIGNRGIVLEYLKKKGIYLPEKIIVDNQLKKSEYILIHYEEAL